MRENIIQLVTALLGSFGFAMFFQLRFKLLPWAALGGIINWGMYLLMMYFTEDMFLSCFFAAAVAALYCEISARILKAPVTLFLVPAIVPSVPGSSLFYMMSRIASNDWDGVKYYGALTAEFTLGIAAGICLLTVIFSIINKVIGKYSKHILN